MSMNTYRCDRIVRDKTIERIESEGGTALFRHIPADEMREHLCRKLEEETLELIEAKTKEERLSEYADVFDVLRALRLLDQMSDEDIVAKSAAKLEGRGGFLDGLFLESLTVPEGSRLDLYCKNDPEKYPKSE